MSSKLSVRLMAQQSAAIEQRQQINTQPLTATIKQTEKDTNQTKIEMADGSVAVGYNYSAAQLSPDQSVRYQSGQVVTKTGLNR